MLLGQLKIQIFIFSFLSLAFNLLAQDSDPGATISSLIGKVSIKSGSDTKSGWKTVKVNETVKNGDILMTGNGSMATVRYKDSEFKLTQNTTLAVNSLYTKEKDAHFEVKQGLAWFKLVNLNGKKFVSTSPTSSAGVRGTAFATVYDEKAKADLTCVCEGKVEVTPKTTGGKSAFVEKGNGVSVKSGEASLLPISYKGEMLKGESLPGFEKKIKAYPILKNCLSCHTPRGWTSDGFTKDEQYGK
jgi:hypothetical protein